MERIENTRVKGAGVSFRRRVPGDLIGRIHQREIVRSLRTNLVAEARRRSRLLWAQTERVFEMVREDPGLTAEQCQSLLAMVRMRCDHADEVRLAQHGSLFDIHGPAPADAEALICESFSYDLRAALARNDVTEHISHVADYAARLGLTVMPGSLTERMMARTIMRGLADSYDAAAARFKEEVLPFRPDPPELDLEDELVGYPFDDPVPSTDDDGDRDPFETLDMSVGETDPPKAGGCDGRDVGVASAVDTSEPPIVSPLPATLGSLWASFTADLVRMGQWSKDNAKQSRATAAAWASLFGDLDVREIGTRHGAEFRRTMIDLPALYSKAPCWSGRPLRDVANERRRIVVDGDADLLRTLTTRNKGREPSLKRLSATTFNRHVSALMRFWSWARQNEHVDAIAPDPFAKLWLEVREDIPAAEGGRAERPMWTDAQLRVLFGSPAYTGCASPHRRHKPGRMIVRDALYWLPLIAATTGMRREEIAQLIVGDVKRDVDSGIWHFDLTRRDMRLKNRESRRLVPIPDILLAFGILDHLVNGRDPSSPLLAELRPNAKGIYGDGVGKRFGRYRLHIGLDQPLLDIHALRHTVATNLNRAGVPQAHGEELLGHRSPARRTAFAIYDKGATLRVLKNALDSLPTDWLEGATRSTDATPGSLEE